MKFYKTVCRDKQRSFVRVTKLKGTISFILLRIMLTQLFSSDYQEHYYFTHSYFVIFVRLRQLEYFLAKNVCSSRFQNILVPFAQQVHHRG